MIAADLDPISAVTAPDPYPYYAQLVADRPFYRDDRIGMWVATSARAVDAVLASPTLRVRPPSEPVPKAILGTSAGETFGRLVRMTDGPSQTLLKTAMNGALDRADLQAIGTASSRCAEQLVQGVRLNEQSTLAAYMVGLPALVVATMFGFSPSNAEQAIDWAGALVGALTPGAGPSEIASGAAAIDALRACVQSLLDVAEAPGSLLVALAEEARRNGIAEDVTIANMVGLFLQGYEGTAGLIGNTLLALASHPYEQMDTFVTAVARNDSPVHNTRRYAASDMTLMNAHITAGDCILVVLAAANRDPLGERMYTFGGGRHACNGAQMAVTMASAGVACLLKHGVEPSALSLKGYLPRPNVRVPVFG